MKKSSHFISTLFLAIALSGCESIDASAYFLDMSDNVSSIYEPDVVRIEGQTVLGLNSALTCAAQTDQIVYTNLCSIDENAAWLGFRNAFTTNLMGDALMVDASLVGLTSELLWESIEDAVLKQGKVNLETDLNTQTTNTASLFLASLGSEDLDQTETAGERQNAQRKASTRLMASQAVLPVFLPWPPPKPTTFSRLGEINKQAVSLKSTADFTLEALREAGYERVTALAVPNGIALSTPLERIKEDGTPEDPSSRWTTSKQRLSPGRFSLFDYFAALLGSSEGHFRAYLFVIGPEYLPSFSQSATKSDIATWQTQGLVGIPSTPETKQRSTQAPNVTVLVYEFRRSSDANEILASADSRLSVIEHLENSQIELIK